MNKQTPFDGKMILVIALTFATWVGYQTYLKKKYPEYGKSAIEQSADSAKGSKDAAASDEAPVSNETPSQAAVESALETAEAKSEAATANAVIDQKIVIEDDIWSVTVNSRGMGISAITLKDYSDRDDMPIQFIPTKEALNFETNIIGSGRPLYFNIQKTADQQITGTANVSGMQIVKIYNFDSNRHSIGYEVRVNNPSDAFSGITTKLTDTINKAESGGFFNPQRPNQEFYVSYDGTDDRQILEPETDEKQSFVKVNIAALASQYFALAMVDESKMAPDFKTQSAPVNEESGAAIGVLSHQRVPGQDFQVKMLTYAGPKSWDFLSGVNENLTALVNFGFFQTLAKWIFKLLQIIHAAVGNWGVAIVLLTVLVRVVLMPFNIMSYKSMKAMSKVQPQIKAIREKYKNDAQMANQEIMKVMKEAKANPIGGCLPMLLQIPVFFALYQVLGQSIELYKAPFALWITDLSLKDPYFVLPVLMGATMFMQQKITPSTMEPAQQKVLMFMPVFLTFLLASLPSGLTLYMFVSTLFAVLQQLYFMRDEKRRAVATA